MTILLINDNPVVSRLLSLCTRSDEMSLEKVSNINEASAGKYDVLFVDEASCEGDVASLSTRLDVGKKIYLSYSDDAMAGFDETVRKPFLPSQITEILKSVTVEEVEEEVVLDETEVEEIDSQESSTIQSTGIFPLSSEVEDEGEDEEITSEVLDRNEIEKIKVLLDMDEDETDTLELDDEAYESRKVEAIKEQLIADGLEIFEEEEMVDELSKENETLTQSEEDEIRNALEKAIKKMKPKKIKKLLKGKEIKVKIKLEDHQ